jgi:OOP family OmpA-OmpF porin
MKKFILAIAAITSMTATSAFAEGYVGGAIGQGHINVDCEGASTCKLSSTGYKIFGGYKFSPNLAGEVTYFDFGKADIADPGLSLNLKTTGIGLGVAFSGNFAPQWSGVARLGIASNRVKAFATLGAASGSDSESSTNAYAGIGIGYEISKGLKLDASLDFSRGKIEGESADLRLFSVGVTYSF